MNRIKLSCIALGVLLLTTGTAHASEGGGYLWGNFFFRILNLALFIGVIWYFFGAKIKGFFTDRSKGIANEISGLEQKKATAQEKLTEIEQRISDLDSQRDSILDTYRKQGEALEAEIVANAKKSAEQISEQAKVAAQNEIDQALEAMRSQVADEIINAAEVALAKKLSASEQAKLVDKYLNKVVLN